MMGSPWRARSFRRDLRPDERGFTLVEMMIAIAVMALMFAGAALVLGSTIGGAAESRLKHHAVEAATEILEGTRAIDYASVATQNITADIAALSASGTDYIAPKSGFSGQYTFDPDGAAGPLSAEDVVLTNSAAIDPVQVLQRNGAQFTVWTIVSDPDSTSSVRVKRVTTRISWVQDGRTYVRTASTLVTETRRGLPLPNFTVGDDATIAAETDQVLHLPFSITNNGARDNWNISVTSSPSAAWTSAITLYRDNAPADGLYSAGESTLTDVSGDSTIDTGLIETDDARKLVGHIDLAAWDAIAGNDVTAGTYTLTFSLVSASQPTTPAKTVTLTVQLNTPVVACGCTYEDFNLLNALPQSSADTNIVTGTMPATLSAPTLTTLPNYDKNKDSAANSGRTIETGGTDYSENTSTEIAKWEYQLGSANTVKTGNITMNVWVAAENLAAGTVRLNGYARYSTTGSATNPIGAGSGTTGNIVVSAGQWTLVTVSIPVTADQSIAANKYLRFYLTNAGSTNVWVSYGTASQPSHVEIPMGTNI
jgi:prepilin-type N-terminal cleavage/methylation domain-containing protein